MDQDDFFLSKSEAKLHALRSRKRDIQGELANLNKEIEEISMKVISEGYPIMQRDSATRAMLVRSRQGTHFIYLITPASADFHPVDLKLLGDAVTQMQGREK